MRRALAAGAALLVLLPFLVPAGWVAVLTKMLIAALFALAFNLLAGQAGMLSFGHAAYFGAGAFGTLHLMRAAEAGLGVPTPLLPLAGLASGLLCGLVCGAFATRRSGVYFSMITLAIAELFYSLAPNLQTLFGGEGGISSMRMPFAGLAFGSDREVYYLVAAWTVLATAGLYYLTLTPFGRLALALRENETRVRFLGYDAYQTRIVVFAISAMVSGLAGGLLAVADESANYVLFESGTSAAVVLGTFIGGSGVFLGPALGAMLLTGFSSLVSDVTHLVLLYEGALFILVMIYIPQGIAGNIAGDSVGGIAPGRVLTWRGGPGRLRPALMVSLPLLCLAVAGIATMELTGRILATENLSLVKRAGHLVPVSFAGLLLAPAAWAIPVGLLLVSLAALRWGVAWARREGAETKE